MLKSTFTLLQRILPSSNVPVRFLSGSSNDINQVTLIGYVHQVQIYDEPDRKKDPYGTMWLLTRDKYRGPTSFLTKYAYHRISLFDEDLLTLAKSTKQGQKLLVKGSLRTSKSTSTDQWIHSILAEEIWARSDFMASDESIPEAEDQTSFDMMKSKNSETADNEESFKKSL